MKTYVIVAVKEITIFRLDYLGLIVILKLIFMIYNMNDYLIFFYSFYSETIEHLQNIEGIRYKGDEITSQRETKIRQNKKSRVRVIHEMCAVESRHLS